MPEGGTTVDDIETLSELNLQFIEAFRRGSWELLEPILSPSFLYLDRATGEVWAQERYLEDLQHNPLPTIGIDQGGHPRRRRCQHGVRSELILARTTQPVRRHVRREATMVGGALTPASGRCVGGFDSDRGR
jgi:hypothetical protein